MAYIFTLENVSARTITYRTPGHEVPWSERWDGGGGGQVYLFLEIKLLCFNSSFLLIPEASGITAASH